jgi:SAM-dependent methyltransferase
MLQATQDAPVTKPQSLNEGTGKENEIYSLRFNDSEDRTRAETWKVLCAEYFQKFIRESDVVVDLGAGDGLFSRNIKAGKIIAVDISEHVRNLEKRGIQTVVAPATSFSSVIGQVADVVFMSNFLEHLPDKAVMLKVLEECKKALKPGGRVIILQPNIRYVGGAYWDYIDHHIAITEQSLVEALEVTGFQVDHLIPRFLPYTARSRMGRLASLNTSKLVSIYLKLPFLWRFFGKQTLAIGSRKDR